jgi:hypothetical protein
VLPTDGDRPTDQATWKKRTSKESAAAQQPKDQDLHHSRHFFDHDYTDFDGAFAHTLKETTKQRKQAGGSRTLRFTLTKQDKLSIPAQERKPRQLKLYLTTYEQHIYYQIKLQDSRHQGSATPRPPTQFI